MINDRLKEIREATKKSQAEFARAIGMGQSSLAMMEVGKREILDRHIKTICSIYNVNEDWLRTGIGDMYVKTECFSLDDYARERDMSPLDLKLMKCYLDMPKEMRELLLSHLKDVFDNKKENFITDEETSATLEKEADEFASKAAEITFKKTREQFLFEKRQESQISSVKDSGEVYSLGIKLKQKGVTESGG